MKPLILLLRKTKEKDIRLCVYNDDNALFAYQKVLFSLIIGLKMFFSQNLQEKERRKNMLDLLFG